MGPEVEAARGVAARALGRQDLSRKALGERLARSGIEADLAACVIDDLTEAGYVDERRLAINHARALAARHYGDEGIAARLAGEGLPAAEIEAAFAELLPEDARAHVAVRALTGSIGKRCAALRRRGFSEAAIEAAAATLDASDR